MKVRILFQWLLPVLAVVFFSCNPQKRLAKKQKRYMADVYTEMKQAVNEAEVTILNDTVKVLFPEHLLFKKNESEIAAETFPLMERFAKALNKYSKTSILINGYTDMTGGAEFNQQLSKERADAARATLLKYAVNDGRLFTWGLGNKNPIADNSSEDGRRKNRRVEFIMLYAYEPEK